ncbi:hypothetical protein [Actinophytocola sp.]|uniref:hypothetical protein n=1 Tax=Actinophytocola sp. TaxID=1872138 RepID=UPI002ED0DCBA
MAHSDGFFVDPAALSGAQADIGRLLGDMAEFKLDPDHSPSVFGHDELAESAKEFHDRWQDGVEELADETERIYRGLGDTIGEYKRVDAENAALIEELGDDDGGR